MTVKVLMRVAPFDNFQLKQMEIKTAYLGAPIEEPVFIEQLEGFDCLDE